ncbi:MAG: ParA family protein [Peptococcaceae bacterium]|jgi:chromosome partitioning protein|nr:ParA family protein [Peptococcaceae bacterium]
MANQKGGVGKSTTAVNLGEALARAGHKVLIVDLDPQANASFGLDTILGEGEPCSYGFLMGTAALADVVRHSTVPGLDFVPASIELANAELELVNMLAREKKLDRALNMHAGDYDYVLVDTPPSLGQLLTNALVAAQYVIIPVLPHPYGLSGINNLLNVIDSIREAFPDRIQEWFVLPCIVSSNENIVASGLDKLRGAFADRVLQTEIRKNVKLAEASDQGKPIYLYSRSSPGALDYQALATEIIALTVSPPAGEGV